MYGIFKWVYSHTKLVSRVNDSGPDIRSKSCKSRGIILGCTEKKKKKLCYSGVGV